LLNISFFIGSINVISLLLIIPIYGVAGAAWMVAAAAACNFTLHFYYYCKVYRGQIAERRLRITLIDLSNDPQATQEWIRTHYKNSEIESLAKAAVKDGSPLAQLRRLRKNERDIFIIFCDRLEWQTRCTPMLIFGLLAGARECLLVDCQGKVRRRPWWMILTVESTKLLVEALGSFLVVLVSWVLTVLLEAATKQNIPYTSKRRTDKPPKITFIRTTPTSGAQTGGANSHITGFTGGALALGAQLNFLSNDAISGIKREQTPIEIIVPTSFFNAHRMIFELWNNLVFTVRALPIVGKTRPDFLYQRYSRFSWAGVAISYFTGIPLILEYNGSEVWIGRHWDAVSLLWLLVRFERLNLLGAQLIFVVSDVEKRNLIRAGVAANKIHVNPNGVNPETFSPGRGGIEVRNKLGINDQTVVGFVGTFGPWHGVLVLAEAIARLPREANCHFLLIGEGSLKSNVEQLVQTQGCSDRVTFTGRLSHKLVPAYLDACDVLVSPHVPMEDGSEFFGSPTKLFEYMAMAKPIIASRLGQIADVIKNDFNGLLIEPGNVNALVSAILQLACQPEQRARLGRQARLDAIENYTWIRNAARVIDAYKIGSH
ncbi:MAG: glycosyltransferase family 4 protein, partial [Acidobacteriota bacterium]